MVSSRILVNAGNGVRGNLVLPCTVSSTWTPTIAWFRGGTPVQGGLVTGDGTLVLNVREGVEASRNGTQYYCLAYNRVILERMTFRGVIRSRDVVVRHTCKPVVYFVLKFHCHFPSFKFLMVLRT